MNILLRQALRRVHPRHGLRLYRWSPLERLNYNLLSSMNLVEIDLGMEEEGALVTLTSRGKTARLKKS